MKWAMVFPGQGSQAVGMMGAYQGIPQIRETFAEASEALSQDLWELVATGPAEELNLTTNTQPVMLTAGVAVFRAWQALGAPLPSLVAGHSLGEYSALVAARSLAFQDAVRLVRIRAAAMQSAVPKGEGAMAAILGLDDAAIAEACAEAAQGDVVQAANFNAAGQTVIAGQAKAVERAIAAAKQRGAKRAVLLPVSAPFHCALMKPAAERLEAALADIRIASPEIPVIHNVDVSLHAQPDAIAAALVRQAYSPVRWVETISRLSSDGAAMVVECGPGKVLAGLTKRIVSGLDSLSLHDTASLETAIAKIKESN